MESFFDTIRNAFRPWRPREEYEPFLEYDYFKPRLCIPSDTLPEPGTVYSLTMEGSDKVVAVMLNVDDYQAFVDAGVIVENFER
jgi:hypothetical protein